MSRQTSKLVQIAAVFAVGIAASATAAQLPAGKPYPQFSVGVTGIYAKIQSNQLTVTKIHPKSPAEGRFRSGDVIVAVDGKKITFPDPRPTLGEAINAAEGKDGKMLFTVKRGGSETEVTIQLQPIGSYSDTWPLNCTKSKHIIKQTADYIASLGGPSGGYMGHAEGLFLLSTGDPKYMPVVQQYARKVSRGSVGSHTWNNGYHGVFLGEYYLATGDRSVLPTIKALCDDAAKRQYFGGWNHWGTPGPGYVTGGLMNPAGAQVLTSLILARECGVQVDEGTHDRALRFFYRYAGTGGVSYGDHHPELWWGSNGKNGMVGAAFALLPHPKFQGGAQVAALTMMDSYSDFELGHASHFGSISWPGISSGLVPEHMEYTHRRFRKKLMWYYELTRMPGGGLWGLPQPGKGSMSGIGGAPHYTSGLLGLAYTSPLKTLRITGKPRTRFSVKHTPTPAEEALQHADFTTPDFVKGGKEPDIEPHEIVAKFNKRGLTVNGSKVMPAEWYAKMIRHYFSLVRTAGAHGLGHLGDSAVPHIIVALQSDDARLRVAGLEAISGVGGWGPGLAQRVNISQSTVTNKLLPYILKPLKDPYAPMWEKRHALIAMQKVSPDKIAANAELIKKYLFEEEWYLRVAAFLAFKPLATHTKLLEPHIPELIESYDIDTNLPSRRWGATTLFKEIYKKNRELGPKVVAAMTKSVNSYPIRMGYKKPIDVNNIFETLRSIDMQKHPANVIPLLPAVLRIFPHTSGQHGGWIFTGARWGNIGLIKAAEMLGEGAKPIIATMKAMLPELERKASSRDKGADSFKQCLPQVKRAIQNYESKYGKVTPVPTPTEPPQKTDKYIRTTAGNTGAPNSKVRTAKRSSPKPKTTRSSRPLVARPTVAKASAEGVAKYGKILRGRIMEELKSGRTLTFFDSKMRTRVRIQAVTPDGGLVVRGLRIPITKTIPWNTLPSRDFRSIATATARRGNKQDHAMVAFFLIAAGDKNEAHAHLLAAGEGNGVLEAFGK